MILEGEATGHRHWTPPKKPVLGKFWPKSRSKKVIPAMQRKFFLNLFWWLGGHLAFPSKIIWIFIAEIFRRDGGGGWL
jgi:hypothetical protein